MVIRNARGLCKYSSEGTLSNFLSGAKTDQMASPYWSSVCVCETERGRDTEWQENISVVEYVCMHTLNHS